MTKLTVAEASKRGYATGLSILQAVQKNWLSAEKSADGQILVDVADLEQIFGMPHAPTPASMPRTATGGDRQSAAANDTDQPDGTRTEDGGRSPVPVTGGAELSQPAATDSTDDDRDALHAEIARLRAELDNERRHVTALLEVLSNRVLMPAGDDATADPDQSTEKPSDDAFPGDGPDTPEAMDDDTWLHTSPAAPWHDDAVNAEDAADALSPDVPTEAVFPEDDAEISPPDEARARLDATPKAEAETPVLGTVYAAIPEDLRLEDEDEDEDEDTADDADFVAPVPEDAPVFLADAAHDDLSMPEPQRDEDFAFPQLRADDRPMLGARTEPEMARADTAGEKRSGHFWKLWQLMSLVWIVLIGAFYWFVLDLQSDFTVTGQWIRGNLAGSAPAMQDAAATLLDAARDIFGPPVLLLVAMLVLRGLYRAIRR